MNSFGNYSRHKCWKEIIRIQNTIHQCTPDWDSSSLPASFFSRLANSRPEPPAACQTAAPTDKALWSLPLHKLSQDTVGCPLFSLGLCRASETASLRQIGFVQTHSPVTLCSETTTLVLWQRSRKNSSGCVLLFHHHQEPTVDGNTLQQTLGNIWTFPNAHQASKVPVQYHLTHLSFPSQSN